MDYPGKAVVEDEIDYVDPQRKKKALAWFIDKWIRYFWSYDTACDLLGLATPFLSGELKQKVKNWLNDSEPDDASDMEADLFMPEVYKQLMS